MNINVKNYLKIKDKIDSLNKEMMEKLEEELL